LSISESGLHSPKVPEPSGNQRRGWRALLGLFALPWALAAGNGYAQQKSEPDLNQVGGFVVSLTNAFRAQEGRGKIAVNDRLEATARSFAVHMAKAGRFSHSADGATPSARARGHGYDYCIIAENIAYQFNSTGFATRELAQKFVEGWERSPGHRRNLLDPDVTQTGVAVARGGKAGEYYAVQMFGRPASQSMKFSLTNQSDSQIHYRLGGKTFPLAPRQIRTHTQCKSVELEFDWPGGQKDTTIRPADGDRLVIRRSAASGPGGGFGVNVEHPATAR
jgi:uncharacterized protein YkwD